MFDQNVCDRCKHCTFSRLLAQVFKIHNSFRLSDDRTSKMDSTNNNLLRNVLRPPTRSVMPKKINAPNNLDFNALHWSQFFEETRDLDVIKSAGRFRVYLNGFKQESNAPLIVLLHGGGYSAATWSLFVKSINEICECRIVALDLRGHGSTSTDDDEDLSIDTLVNDIFNVLVCLFGDDQTSTTQCDQSDEATMADVAYTPIAHQIRLPPLCLCGHSMGGALAVHAAYKLSTVCTITGLIVIDVVEGTALDALQSMHHVLKNRKSSFNSIREGIEWCVRNNQTKNIDAARISFPGQIKNRFTNLTATDEYDSNEEPANRSNDINESTPSENLNKFKISDDSIPEDDDEMNCSDDFKQPVIKDGVGKYIWRINLYKSEPYWKSWFENLSKLFLNAPTNGRLLLLAGIDRLDKDLTIGQMQGKFQMQVLPQCGHAVHEDVPDKVAEAIATYLIRNKLVERKKDFQPTFPCC